MATADQTFITTIPDRFIRDETEKIQKKEATKKATISGIVDDLTVLREQGIYNYINQIEPLDIFKYVIIMITMVILSNHIPWTLKHVVGFTMAIIFVYYMQEGKRATFLSRLKTTEIHMEKIKPRPTFFHHDANFIEFAYNMLSYREYNKTAYSNMIKAMDHFLQVQIDIENPALINCTETYQIALDMKSTALNELHSLIHAIPDDDSLVIQTKLLNAIKTLQLYMERHLDEMINICETKRKQIGYNKNTKIINRHELPGMDKLKIPNYHVF